MARYLSRPDEKTLINKNVENYINHRAYYSKFIGSSPAYVEYFSKDQSKSNENHGLGIGEDIVGYNSPIRYGRIKDFPLYSLEGMSPELVNDGISGVGTEVEFSATIIPDTIKPNVDDLVILNPMDEFNIDYNRVYRVNSIEIDILDSRSYYRISLNSTSYDMDILREKQVVENYRLANENIGTSNKSILIEDDFILVRRIEEFTDGLVDNYISTYYDEHLGCLVYYEPHLNVNFYSSDLHEFLEKYPNTFIRGGTFMTNLKFVNYAKDDIDRYKDKYSYTNPLFDTIDKVLNVSSFDKKPIKPDWLGHTVNKSNFYNDNRHKGNYNWTNFNLERIKGNIFNHLSHKYFNTSKIEIISKDEFKDFLLNGLSTYKCPITSMKTPIDWYSIIYDSFRSITNSFNNIDEYEFSEETLKVRDSLRNIEGGLYHGLTDSAVWDIIWNKEKDVDFEGNETIYKYSISSDEIIEKYKLHHLDKLEFSMLVDNLRLIPKKVIVDKLVEEVYYYVFYESISYNKTKYNNYNYSEIESSKYETSFKFKEDEPDIQLIFSSNLLNIEGRNVVSSFLSLLASIVDKQSENWKSITTNRDEKAIRIINEEDMLSILEIVKEGTKDTNVYNYQYIPLLVQLLRRYVEFIVK